MKSSKKSFSTVLTVISVAFIVRLLFLVAEVKMIYPKIKIIGKPIKRYLFLLVLRVIMVSIVDNLINLKRLSCQKFKYRNTLIFRFLFLIIFLKCSIMNTFCPKLNNYKIIIIPNYNLKMKNSNAIFL